MSSTAAANAVLTPEEVIDSWGNFTYDAWMRLDKAGWNSLQRWAQVVEEEEKVKREKAREDSQNSQFEVRPEHLFHNGRERLKGLRLVQSRPNWEALSPGEIVEFWDELMWGKKQLLESRGMGREYWENQAAEKFASPKVEVDPNAAMIARDGTHTTVYIEPGKPDRFTQTMLDYERAQPKPFVIGLLTVKGM